MKKLLILFICFLSVLTVSAQDKDKLERERQELQKELKAIQAEYNKLKGKTKVSLGQLSVLQKKMAMQNKYISNINREIRGLSDEIYLNALEIRKLQAELDTLKSQYARSVVYAYKNKSSYSYLNFIFSANDFNDGIKRASYLKSYRTYRQQQVTNILEKKKEIEQRKEQLLAAFFFLSASARAAASFLAASISLLTIAAIWFFNWLSLFLLVAISFDNDFSCDFSLLTTASFSFF